MEKHDLLSVALSTGRGIIAATAAGMAKENDRSIETTTVVPAPKRGTGPNSAGQSGDTQGLSDVADAGPESVEELVEEGQSFEAEVIRGVEGTPDADVAEVRTREVPEDDVPPEYLDEERPRST